MDSTVVLRCTPRSTRAAPRSTHSTAQHRVCSSPKWPTSAQHPRSTAQHRPAPAAPRSTDQHGAAHAARLDEFFPCSLAVQGNTVLAHMLSQHTTTISLPSDLCPGCLNLNVPPFFDVTYEEYNSAALRRGSILRPAPVRPDAYRLDCRAECQADMQATAVVIHKLSAAAAAGLICSLQLAI